MSYLSHSGSNVPGSESSTYGTFALASESTWERKFQLPNGDGWWEGKRRARGRSEERGGEAEAFQLENFSIYTPAYESSSNVIVLTVTGIHYISQTAGFLTSQAFHVRRPGSGRTKA